MVDTTCMAQVRELLLVDDQASEVLLAKEALPASGAQFLMTSVGSGWEAVSWLLERFERAKSTGPVLVLLDLKMPVWDGEATLRNIRSNPKISQTPVVILTTSKNEPDVERSHQAGANGFVWKPLNFSDFTKFFTDLDQFWFEHIAVNGK